MKKIQNSLEQKILEFIRENNLITAGEKIVVAVSGGPDSVCLLSVLHSLRKKLGIKLHIAHLNHRLRGAESDADAEYVAGLARRLKIPATIESADVKAFRKERRMTLEEAAREIRYCFLATTARKVGAEKAAAGHTSNDQIETVLMHLIRGSGIRGLRGLLPAINLKTHAGELRLIRPLLGTSREDTATYCAEHSLEPRTDATNLSLEPFRNKVRRKLLPELKKYNPQIAAAILRTARSAGDDLDLIEKEARQLIINITHNGKDYVNIDKKKFLAVHPALKRQVLRLSLESLLGSLKDIEAGHIEDMMDALKKPAGKVITLPFGLNFYVDYEQYTLAKDTASLCPFPELGEEFSLNIPGKTTMPGWEITATFLPPSAPGDEDEFTACFDAATTGKKLTVRRSLPGDRFQPLGMTEGKKVHRFMIDARIPKAWRARIPIVCGDGRVIWVTGWRIDERCRVTPTTQKILKLVFKLV